MDILSLIGIVLSVVAIVGGNYLEGGHISALINAPAALIVFGGTIGAVFLQTPIAHFSHGLKLLVWVFFPPRVDMQGGINSVVGWSMVARKDGLLGLESIAESEPDPYAQKGLRLLVDGVEPETIRSIMEVDLYTQEDRDMAGARIYDSMGGYSPTIGIIGAVLGLIQVMGNLANPSQLGHGIAVAFVATVYGVAAANLFFLPFGGKIKAVVLQRSRYREMLLEGILSIADGENPRSIEVKLQGFME